jgi:hypothetical protein
MDGGHVLAIQVDRALFEECDDLVGLQSSIAQKLSALLRIDGHDYGPAQGTLFFLADDPRAAFEAYRDLVHPDGLAGHRIACRPAGSDAWEILWPPDLKAFRVR